MTKGDLAKELRRRQGRVYASLFDTKRFRAIEEQRREGFHSEHQKALPPVELLRSIQDHLVEAKNVDVNVEFLIGAVEPKLAVVGFDWPGRPDLFIVPNSAFMWKSNGWKLTHLFSFTSWGAYAPGVAPGDPGIKSEPACRARIRDG